LKAVVGDDAFDAAGANDPTGLAEFLGDDVSGGFGIEEAMANDLADDFVGAAVVAFGSAGLAAEGGGAERGEGVSELEIALFAEAELACGLEGSEALALALDEHGEFAGDFVVGEDGEGTSGTKQLLELQIEGEHKDSGARGAVVKGDRRECSETGGMSLIKYGGIIGSKGAGMADIY
jgi:hypothetical protein